MKLSNSDSIAKFYSQYPFPNITLNKKTDIYGTLIYRLIYGLTRRYLSAETSKKIKILDVGCGTGELDLGLASNKRDILAIDNNKKSIEIAQKRAKRFKLKINFKHFDFVKNSLPKNHFDYIFSIGVLHHTANPEENFSKLVKSLKAGGYITIGIYNPFGSFKVRLKRGILKLLAGNNFEKKIEIYRKLFYRRPLTIDEEIAVADAFANPYRRYYTFEQLLSWFEKNNIEYLDSAPPIEFSKNIRLIETILTKFFINKEFDLMSSWQKVTYNHPPVKKWELSKILTTFIQLLWVPTGRGELINLVGRKIK